MKKSTLIFLLLAVAAGAALWYYEFKREKKPEVSATDAKPAFTFQEEDVTGIVITRAGEKAPEVIAFEKRGKDWWMTRPLDSAVNSSNVDSIVFRSSSARISKTIPAQAEKLAGFGLASPRLTLELKLKDGKSHRVRFGEKDFTGSDVYALLDDKKDVDVLNGELLSTVDKPVLEFRDRRIAQIQEDDMVRLRVKNKNQALLAEKNEAGKWIVREPASDKGKELISSRVFLTLTNGEAEEILDQPAAAQRARLAKPEIEIDLTGKDGKVYRFSSVPDDQDKEKALFKSSATAVLYKIRKTTHDAMNFKLADVVQEPAKEEPAPAKTPPAKPN